MLAPVHHITPLAAIERERLLPLPGQVLARLNQKVSPTDIVAEAVWARDHMFLDVARMLNLPAAIADRLIRCKVGDQLPAGAVIAVGRGLFPKTIRLARPGRVMAVGEGQVLIESGEIRMELRAGLSGTVVQIIPERGVVISASGALVQCVWGNGRIDSGVILNMAEQPDTVLTSQRLDVSMRGSIMVAGQVRDVETLRAAAELPLRGLILASMPPSLLPTAREMPYPIVLTDGFGALPMNSAAYRLITTNDKREVTLNAEAYDRYSGTRPEIIIPLPVSSEPPVPRDVETFKSGQTVRLRQPLAAGLIGTIVALRPGLTIFPSGVRAAAAEVKLENGEQLPVPLANLEVVG